MINSLFQNSRFLVYVLVLTSFFASVILYIMLLNILFHLCLSFVMAVPDTVKSGKELAVTLLMVLDIGLIALVFQITSIALYQFFICKKEMVDSRFLKVLRIHDFHDLKSILMQVAVLILTVMFLGQAVEYGATLETLYFALSVSCMLVAVVFVTKNLRSSSHDKTD